MKHDIVVSEKTWFVYPQIPLAGVINAGEGLRGPHEPELFYTSFEAAERCEQLGIEYDFEVDIPEAPEPTPEEPTNLEE